MRGYTTLSFSFLGLTPDLLPICLFKVNKKKERKEMIIQVMIQEFNTLKVSEENQSKPREEVRSFSSLRKSSFSSSVSL